MCQSSLNNDQGSYLTAIYMTILLDVAFNMMTYNATEKEISDEVKPYFFLAVNIIGLLLLLGFVVKLHYACRVTRNTNDDVPDDVSDTTSYSEFDYEGI